MQKAKKDVEKGTIHSDMFLLKRETKDDQGNPDQRARLIMLHEYYCGLLLGPGTSQMTMGKWSLLTLCQ